MNKNMVTGIALTVLAAGLAMWVVTLRGGVLEMLVGKAVWYVPYVALVAAVDQFLRAFRGRGSHGRTQGSFR